jgi:hypothetical protein
MKIYPNNNIPKLMPYPNNNIPKWGYTQLTWEKLKV